MNENLKMFSGLKVLSREELRNVFAGTNPDCEEGFVPDLYGNCVVKTENGNGEPAGSSRCDRP
jgi:hypothetical protein